MGTNIFGVRRGKGHKKNAAEGLSRRQVLSQQHELALEIFYGL